MIISWTSLRQEEILAAVDTAAEFFRQINSYIVLVFSVRCSRSQRDQEILAVDTATEYHTESANRLKTLVYDNIRQHLDRWKFSLWTQQQNFRQIGSYIALIVCGLHGIYCMVFSFSKGLILDCFFMCGSFSGRCTARRSWAQGTRLVEQVLVEPLLAPLPGAPEAVVLNKWIVVINS